MNKKALLDNLENIIKDRTLFDKDLVAFILSNISSDDLIGYKDFSVSSYNFAFKTNLWGLINYTINEKQLFKDEEDYNNFYRYKKDEASSNRYIKHHKSYELDILIHKEWKDLLLKYCPSITNELVYELKEDRNVKINKQDLFALESLPFMAYQNNYDLSDTGKQLLAIDLTQKEQSYSYRYKKLNDSTEELNTFIADVLVNNKSAIEAKSKLGFVDALLNESEFLIKTLEYMDGENIKKIFKDTEPKKTLQKIHNHSLTRLYENVMYSYTPEMIAKKSITKNNFKLLEHFEDHFQNIYQVSLIGKRVPKAKSKNRISVSDSTLLKEIEYLKDIFKEYEISELSKLTYWTKVLDKRNFGLIKASLKYIPKPNVELNDLLDKSVLMTTLQTIKVTKYVNGVNKQYTIHDIEMEILSENLDTSLPEKETVKKVKL